MTKLRIELRANALGEDDVSVLSSSMHKTLKKLRKRLIAYVALQNLGYNRI